MPVNHLGTATRLALGLCVVLVLMAREMAPAAQACVESVEQPADLQSRLVVEGMEQARASGRATEALLIALLLVGLATAAVQRG
jgi:hypothetical protein